MMLALDMANSIGEGELSGNPVVLVVVECHRLASAANYWTEAYRAD